MTEEKAVTIAQPQGVIGQYLAPAIKILQEYHILPAESETKQMLHLLDQVSDVDPTRVTAIAYVMQYSSAFNELMRDKTKNTTVGTRYKDISDKFDSIIDDMKDAVEKASAGKKPHSFLKDMMHGGSIPARYQKIKNIYTGLSADLASQVDNEKQILTAYKSFRSALNEAGATAKELEAEQKTILEKTQTNLTEKQKAVETFQGSDADKIRAMGERDRASAAVDVETNKYRFVHDLAENLSLAYNVGETVMQRLAQTNGVKDALYQRSVNFFSTNETVFTAEGVTLEAMLGLHEGTEGLNALTGGMNHAIETMADLGNPLLKEGVQAAYGVTIKESSVKKALDATLQFQTDMQTMIPQLIAESNQNNEKIQADVEEQKKQLVALKAYQNVQLAQK